MSHCKSTVPPEQVAECQLNELENTVGEPPNLQINPGYGLGGGYTINPYYQQYQNQFGPREKVLCEVVRGGFRQGYWGGFERLPDRLANCHVVEQFGPGPIVPLPTPHRPFPYRDGGSHGRGGHDPRDHGRGGPIIIIPDNDGLY